MSEEMIAIALSDEAAKYGVILLEPTAKKLARAALSAYNPNERLRRVGTLFAAIAHGDAEHREWLKEAIDKHLAGEPVPTPRGKGPALSPLPQGT